MGYDTLLNDTLQKASYLNPNSSSYVFGRVGLIVCGSVGLFVCRDNNSIMVKARSMKFSRDPIVLECWNSGQISGLFNFLHNCPRTKLITNISASSCKDNIEYISVLSNE